MKHIELRSELKEYYLNILPSKYEDYCKRCTERLERQIPDDISVYKQKGMQYDIIAESCEPILFHKSIFYYELGSMGALCGGAGETCCGHHPGGWTYRKNRHRFWDQAPELYEKKIYMDKLTLYKFCGAYADERHHFAFNIEPVLKYGLKSLYSNAMEALQKAASEEEQDFLENMGKGLLAVKKISDKFAAQAIKQMEMTDDPEERKRLQQIATSANVSPWSAPRSFYEALAAVAFLQKALGTLEGVGLYSMGRLDVLLESFYNYDIEQGIITKETAYDLISEFLVLWNSHLVKPINSEEYGHTDLAVTYTLGGCDLFGNPICNDLTLLFLKANREEKIVYPKIMCRFSAKSSKEYLDAINKDIIQGRATILYQNDDTMIPALIKKGVSVEDARNYSILGCWEPVVNDSSSEHCGYINLLKIFEFSIWGDFEEKYGIKIESIENAENFEEVYNIVIKNIDVLLKDRCELAMQGKGIWKNVDSLMLLSSAWDSCIEKRKDITAGGTKYILDELPCSGLPNIVDSLLAIKELCFDKKVYTLKGLLEAVRANWDSFEEVRYQVLKCSYWGDEGKESCNLAKRINCDLCKIADQLTTLWGGKVVIGHMLYMEMLDFCKGLRATPDGRRTGDYFSRDLTPSVLHDAKSASSVLNCINTLDTTEFAANSLVNVIIPFCKDSLDLCEAYVRAAALSSVQALHINCVTKEELLDAQVHPEKHTDLVVRVCGFSDKFISLTKAVQNEFLERNFYEYT